MKGMEIKQLRCFVAVAEELHFSRAAERLGVDQSLLSKRIRALEMAVGTRLLRRTTRRSQLTIAGERMLEEAVRVLELLDEMPRAARRAVREVNSDSVPGS